ncbi:hypothetical protein D918_01918 [Trichuris suis]|uniref:Uncharacterized protein n=1 Tax=Trichuris suis TaxID=68888 RepID=A0A085M3I9_9BILA|nr:hypothetical protein M513_07312 [Trichuris suis]KHJ47761.1 hypothetical protein D918_01918 [Trichuris suis]
MVKELADQFVPLDEEFHKLAHEADDFIEKCIFSQMPAEECLELTDELEKLMAVIDNRSQLYSGNRTWGKMNLQELRMLKGPAYIGMLLTIGDFSDEKKYLEKAIAYMNQYLMKLKKLRIFNHCDANTLMWSDRVDYADGKKNLIMLSFHKRTREKLLQCDTAKARLKAFLLIKQANPEAKPDLRDLRRLCYSELRYYGHLVIEKLFFAKASLKNILNLEEMGKHLTCLLEKHLLLTAQDSKDSAKVCSESKEALPTSTSRSCNDEQNEEKTMTDDNRRPDGAGTSKKKRRKRRGRK